MQLTTLRRQLLAVNAKLAAASNTSWGAREQLSSLQNELKEVNIRMEAAQAEIDHLHTQCTLLNAAKGAAEAHCTLRTLEAEDLRKQLDETKRKSKRPRLHNSLGRFLTLPQAQAAFETQQEQRTTQLAAEAAKQADKQAAEHMRELQRADNALHKTFTSPLASYIRKDDLKDIAAALTLDQTGTIAELQARCKEHLAHHPELQSHPRFEGLFAVRRTRRTHIHGRQAPVLSDDTNTSTISLAHPSMPVPLPPSSMPVPPPPSFMPVLPLSSSYPDPLPPLNLPPFPHP